MTAASEWYSLDTVASEYDSARLQRLFIRGWHGILRAVADRVISKPPLSAVFDYLYMSRLIANARETFEAADILDIGCGSSYIYRHLLAEGWQGRCSGLDVSPAMLAVARRNLAALRESSPPHVQRLGHLFRYVDRLGRDTIAEGVPSVTLDYDALDWLENHLHVGSIEAEVHGTFTAATGFSGPLCFYPPARQMHLLGITLGHVLEIATLQFKNSRFADYDGGVFASETAALITAIISGQEPYPHAALAAWAASRPSLPLDHNVEVEEAHEVGGFPYWRVDLSTIRSKLEECGWVITGVTTMGFTSQTFFGLVDESYRIVEGPAAARLLSRIRTIDDFFCEEVLVGDNIQITTVPQRLRPSPVPSVQLKRGASFRSAYRPI